MSRPPTLLSFRAKRGICFSAFFGSLFSRAGKPRIKNVGPRRGRALMPAPHVLTLLAANNDFGGTHVVIPVIRAYHNYMIARFRLNGWRVLCRRGLRAEG